MIETIRQGLKDEGFEVSVSQLCRWFGVPRRTVYYRSTKAAPKLRDEFVAPIKALIEQEPSFGYRTVASLLGMNKNTVQRVFQLMGGRLRKLAVGPGRASRRGRGRRRAISALDDRPVPDAAGPDGWLMLALMIGCNTRQ